MKASESTETSVHALQKAYSQVLAHRKANASMLRWSLQFSAAEKERKSAGRGFTLYLL